MRDVECTARWPCGRQVEHWPKVDEGSQGAPPYVLNALKLLALNLYDDLAGPVSSPEMIMNSLPLASELMASITEEIRLL